MKFFADPSEIRTTRQLAMSCAIMTVVIACTVTVFSRLVFDAVFPGFSTDVRIVTSVFAFVMTVLIAAPLLWAFGALNVQLIQANVKLEAMANLDPLTGLMNRRAFVERFDGLDRKADRKSDHVAMMIVDADHFKAINDTHGHDGGDTALVHLSNLLAEFEDDRTIVARLGGEEFVVCRFGPDVSRQLADDLCQKVARSELTLGGHRVPLTVSVGYRQFQPGENLAEMMRDADDAVYRAKAGGRNRVVIATRDVPPLAPELPARSVQLGEQSRARKSLLNS